MRRRHDFRVRPPQGLPADVAPAAYPAAFPRAILREAERVGVKRFYVEDESDQAHEQIVKDLHYLKTVRI